MMHLDTREGQSMSEKPTSVNRANVGGSLGLVLTYVLTRHLFQPLIAREAL